MVAIRRADSRDAAALAALAERTFRDTFAADNTPDDMDRHCAAQFGRAIQAREIADPEVVTLLAEEACRLIGFTQTRINRPRSGVAGLRPAELHRIYVAAEWLGRGVAKQLLEAAIASAAAENSDGIWLGVWEHNPRAIAFYAKSGFQVVGEHAFMLGQAPQRDLIMSAPVR